ncbi:hypothetical protein CON69_19875 [Bacillus pseudomycoides]|nr:hypothetical protein CON69_19875 [Bacillus pseudomycoides]
MNSMSFFKVILKIRGKGVAQAYFSSTSEPINFKSYVLIALVEVNETIKHKIILYIAYTFYF